jgi:hypothetical protein
MLTQKFVLLRKLFHKLKKYSEYVRIFQKQQTWIIQSWKRKSKEDPRSFLPLLAFVPPSSSYRLAYKDKPPLATHREERRERKGMYHL